MVSPFILRRLKTDKSIISDLPDKIEQLDHVQLSKKQVVLYRKEVKALEKSLKEVDGMERRGLILAYITRFKQICNHPDQFLGQKTYAPEESGKFEVLRELCETIYEKRERVLVFTQYREVTEELADFLKGIFKHDGFILHGGTHVKTRTKMVEAFNDPDNYIPFMVLSVKAAGTGLNLTAANHVILTTTWWGDAWCANLEQYADYESRLDRGKRYVRSGTVVDLKINGGKITALVQGRRKTPYKVDIQISPLSEEQCQSIIDRCGERIDNMEALVKGSFPEGMKDVFTGENGLFPTPREISFRCSCPDWALMCKHVAATMYAIGVRLDENPFFFFKMRGIDVDRFIDVAIESRVEKMLSNADAVTDRVIVSDDALVLFGL